MYGIFGAINGGSAFDGGTLSILFNIIKVHIMTRKVSMMVVEVMRLPSGLCDEFEDLIFVVSAWE